MANIKKEYERWLANATADTDVAAELKTLDDAKIEDAFYRNLAFGTGGLRGVMDVSKFYHGDYYLEEEVKTTRGKGIASRKKSSI